MEEQIKNLEQELVKLEDKYGGLVTNIKRNVISPHEPKGHYSIHQGGDRMLQSKTTHGYGIWYSKYMLPFINKKITIAEVGILNGSGLAIWCDIFKEATIYGYDIDTNIFKENFKNLSKLGAFKKNKPYINSIDQWKDNSELLIKTSKGKKYDIVIDDGCHVTEANLKTFQSFLPHLSDNFVYFIEDNRKVHFELEKLYPQFEIFHHIEMTIITPKK
jgi:hypothetical protein